MKWQFLKENKCPNCKRDLSDSYIPVSEMFVCRCGFKISAKKFKDIVNDVTNKHLQQKWDEQTNGTRYGRN